jgi:hypothetical protein
VCFTDYPTHVDTSQSFLYSQILQSANYTDKNMMLEGNQTKHCSLQLTCVKKEHYMKLMMEYYWSTITIPKCTYHELSKQIEVLHLKTKHPHHQGSYSKKTSLQSLT